MEIILLDNESTNSVRASKCLRPTKPIYDEYDLKLIDDFRNEGNNAPDIASYAELPDGKSDE